METVEGIKLSKTLSSQFEGFLTLVARNLELERENDRLKKELEKALQREESDDDTRCISEDDKSPLKRRRVTREVEENEQLKEQIHVFQISLKGATDKQVELVSELQEQRQANERLLKDLRDAEEKREAAERRAKEHQERLQQAMQALS